MMEHVKDARHPLVMKMVVQNGTIGQKPQNLLGMVKLVCRSTPEFVHLNILNAKATM